MGRIGIPVAFVASVATMRSLRGLSVLAVLCSLMCLSPAAAQHTGLDGAISPKRMPFSSFTTVRKYDFNVELANISVNCYSKPIATVNGQFPGPPIFANENDRVVVNVTNKTQFNMTIHFNGVRQVRSPWMDGVAFVTQCPIPPGGYFTYDFSIPNQHGTLLYHAHFGWQRATVHGPIITYPENPDPYPAPFRDFPVVLAEWWNEDVQKIEDGLFRARSIPGAFPLSDAMTINGKPGPGYNCTDKEGISTLKAVYGKTYKLRIINAATNAQLFFSVANHNLRVVEVDAEYVQPFDTPIIMLSPGQTTDALLTADQEGGTYYMSASDYGILDILKPYPVAVLTYETPKSLFSKAVDFVLHYPGKTQSPNVPTLPSYQDHDQVYAFNNALRTLYPGRVPLDAYRGRRLKFTVGWAFGNCAESDEKLPKVNCVGGGFVPRFYALGAVNSISFATPTISILEAKHFKVPNIYTEDFPTEPEHPWDYTCITRCAEPTANFEDRIGELELGTRIIPVEYNETVNIILQDTSQYGFENIPFHLHGHNFWVMGQGRGNYDDEIDGPGLNDYDPPLRNTVGVPFRGWVVIRFKANNPGVWFFNSNLATHLSYGMATVFDVKNGEGERQQYLPPPPDSQRFCGVSSS